jgi:hypothetical protein
MIWNGTKVYNNWGPRNTYGLVKDDADLRGTRIGNYFYRGPHLEISPYFYKRFGITLPLRPSRRRFSTPGNSGAWVVEAADKTWVGLIVGAEDPPNTRAYAISAYFLLDGFERFTDIPRWYVDMCDNCE